ncbi:QcrA and Rieske domain-containing protein [Pedobacter alluvionis]|uniref:Rieske (2Fe-2S) protein n=1 Tax=Pedobacter alluvionis TaxID=475253 RepID=A0A497YC67_9SPHI|nr:Rieske 2Fe-2S domain-containing protein [Pedobacter alluvionis]RLJ80268.1 Rieske Fe-S protein [Pedobacter alluvionis]TFB31542.1 Rieske (2Fe-2S) protein [Pedobacter alluvionis]
MDRKYFLNSIGMSAAAFALINCVGCKKTDGSSSTDTTGPTGVNFTLDLSRAANAALLSNGGSLVSNGVIVAKTMVGAYIAVQRSCTHESYTLIYQSANSRFYCSNHGATFSENGAVTNGPPSHSLTVYNTQLKGNTLKVYS